MFKTHPSSPEDQTISYSEIFEGIQSHDGQLTTNTNPHCATSASICNGICTSPPSISILARNRSTKPCNHFLDGHQWNRNFDHTTESEFPSATHNKRDESGNGEPYCTGMGCHGMQTCETR